ncbi:MAG: non-hydrolyzing UDP-N-acetylglucosamine 2-epimerase [Bdellovibrionota bacterium]
MKKILCFAGTRPEAIKLAPVIQTLRNFPDQVDAKLCSTGQHREMIHQAFSDFQLRPDFDLDVMQPNQTLASLSGKLFQAIGSLLIEEKPDWVVVQGDTTTAMVASLCAFYAQIPVAHVEAGLRSFDLRAPFPEEVNRRVAGLVATLHFAPTEAARRNLEAERVPAKSIFVTGNTVIDALLWMLKVVRAEKPRLPEEVEKMAAEGRKIVLITGHRRENFGGGFEQICHAIRELSEKHPEAAFVYPVHLNPNVQKPVQAILGGCDRVSLIAPLGYKQFIRLMDLSTLILSDSGGIQEEGPSLGKPVLVMREITERPEGVAAGANKLVGTDREKIVFEVGKLLTDLDAYKKMANVQNPYGDGKAADRIVKEMLHA